MIDYTYKELFNQDSIDKQIVIAFDGGEITNTDLYAESFELKESLCSDEELRFGSCEASVLKLKIRNEFGELKNKWLNISMVLDGNADIPFQFGKYKVYSDEPSGDRKYTNITAYDAMYDIINTDVSEWYNSLTFPITQKEFRDSFFEYFGIEQEEVELIQDSMTIEQTISTTSISGKDIITAICELDGVFGHINRQGNFEYISLADKTSEILYPKIELYPSSDLYTTTTPYSTKQHSEIVSSSRYISCEYEDFETCFISKLQIRQEENDIGAVVGDGANTYIVEDNFLVYGKSSDELSEIAERLLEKIKLIQYRPMKAIMKGNPCLEVGDAVVFHTRYKDIEGYVLERTIKGIQALKDTLESKGVYEYLEKVNSVQRDIKQLKGKTNVLKRTVEELESIITDEENGLQTQVTQTANKVEVMAGDSYVSSKISVELGKVVLKGNRLVIESDNFTLDENGNVVVNGVFTQETEDGVKSIEIKNNQIKFYDWEGVGDYVGSIGATKNPSTGRVGIDFWCDDGDYLSIGSKDNSQAEDANIMPVIRIDSTTYQDSTPWIRNTTGGTLFPDNPNGGVIVEHGLIKDWSLKGVNTKLFADNPNGGITIDNGLVTECNLYTSSGTLFPDNPGGGITVKNGLITGWGLNYSYGTLSVICGLGWNSDGITSVKRADITITNGLITGISYTTTNY